MKQKKQKSPLGLRLIRGIAWVLLIVSAAYLGQWYWHSRQNKKANQQTAAAYLTPVTVPEAGADAGGKDQSVQVDFDALHQVSPRVIGWIRISGLSVVDYPIVQGDNTYYLNHAWDGSASRYGAIFMEQTNAPDFSDYHTIVYGHNMKDKAMFGELTRYAQEDFWAENGGLITIYTPDTTLTYQIFSAEYADPTDPGIYTVGFSPGEEYADFLQGLCSRSAVASQLSVQNTDHVLTLSTCAYGDKERFVLHAKRLS